MASILAKHIQAYLYQYPFLSLLILGGLALGLGFFLLWQTMRWWRYLRDKRKVFQQIKQHYHSK